MQAAYFYSFSATEKIAWRFTLVPVNFGFAFSGTISFPQNFKIPQLSTKTREAMVTSAKPVRTRGRFVAC